MDVPGNSSRHAHQAVWAGVTFQPSDAFQQVRVPQPSHAQPRDSSWRNRFAASPVSHGLRHPASVSRSPPLRLTSSRSRGRACPGTAQFQFRRVLHSKHAQAASPPNGRATLAGRTPGNVPAPHLIGSGGAMAGHHPGRRLACTTAVMLPRRATQDTIKARLRGHVPAAVRQRRYDLAGRQTGKLHAVGHLKNLLAFRLA